MRIIAAALIRRCMPKCAACSVVDVTAAGLSCRACNVAWLSSLPQEGNGEALQGATAERAPKARKKSGEPSAKKATASSDASESKETSTPRGSDEGSASTEALPDQRFPWKSKKRGGIGFAGSKCAVCNDHPVHERGQTCGHCTQARLVAVAKATGSKVTKKHLKKLANTEALAMVEADIKEPLFAKGRSRKGFRRLKRPHRIEPGVPIGMRPKVAKKPKRARKVGADTVTKLNPNGRKFVGPGGSPRGIRQDGKPRTKPGKNKPKDKKTAAFGKKLAAARKRLGLKQWEVADKAGLSQPGYANIERGVAGSSPDTQKTLARVLRLGAGK